MCILQIKKYLNFLSIGCCNNETAVAGVRSMHIYILYLVFNVIGDHSGTVVKVLCYKLEGHWFNPGWCHWNFSLT